MGDEIRQRIEAREMLLSPIAAKSAFSRGRERPEKPSSMRSDFQRDRDRVIHCKSFRRLMHKTQVFIAPLGDHYVTRLTHTIELAQIARTIARGLNLNEDLVEAIALAHDLGHPPFGHTGEEVLDELVPGGFRHNHQSLRVIDVLEKDGEGLNLTWEARESIPKHSKPRESVAGAGWGVASTLEGQICKIADAVAYLNHDIGDAIRARLLSEEKLPQISRDVLGTRHSQRIDTMVGDIINTSAPAARTTESSEKQTRDEYECLRAELDERAERGVTTIGMSLKVQEAVDALRNFMFENVYLDSDAKEEVERVREMLRALFQFYCDHPERLPAEARANSRNEPIQRVVADYIAGLTDRYALKAFEDAFYPRKWSVLD